MNEHEMSDLLERAGSGLDPDVARLVAGGTARGRRQRRRRRAGTAVTGLVAVSAVTALGFSLLPGSEPTARDGATTASAPDVGPGPGATPPAERAMAVEPDLVGQRLSRLVPAGEVSDVRSWSGSPAAFRAGSVLLDGALVSIILQRTDGSGCDELPAGQACVPHGDDLLSGGTYQEPASGGGPSGIVATSVTRHVADGFEISATAWNAPGEKGVEPVMEQPVLSEEQLTALVDDEAWLTEPTGATWPADPDGPNGSGGDDAPAAAPVTVAAADIPGVVAGLLGDGEVTSTLAEAPYPPVDSVREKIVHFRWNGTLTTVTLGLATKRAGCQRQARDLDGVACAQEGGNEVLRWGPTTADGISAQGVSVWQQGWIVSAVSYNAADGKAATPLLPEPAISLDELTAVAASDVWFS